MSVFDLPLLDFIYVHRVASMTLISFTAVSWFLYGLCCLSGRSAIIALARRYGDVIR